MIELTIDRPPGRVVVGMSGGVDSSVTAAILKEAGFDVIGVTMQIWHRSSALQDETVSAGCCTIDAIDDARRVARHLGIPYYVPNFRQPFSVVVDDFVREYAAGRTPNPCVRCNQFVRFDGLLAKAVELEADYIATGHYARVVYDADRNEYLLLKAVDPLKDQSYVLHTLQQHHLARLLLPLGALTKTETRALARRYRLPVAEKPDSQEICFVAGGNYREFLKQTANLESRPGPIVDVSGAVIGEHQGIHHYTVGQRKGLNIGGGPPRYVIELRPKDNTIVVGRREDAMYASLECADVHFIGARPSEEFRAQVKVRYRAPEQPATISVHDGDRVHVAFHEPVWGVAPGQLAVFYEGERVLGGGTIVHAQRV
jgi:tRNA-specific 2-thiouridylase